MFLIFQETFLLVNTGITVILEIFFLFFNITDIKIVYYESYWSFYTLVKVLLTT